MSRSGDGGARSDAGFTLIEVLIALVLSSMIIGAVASALITSANVARTTTDQVGDSTDAGLISSFLVHDAQSAGGIDRLTAERVDTLGVTTNQLVAPVAGCAQPATFAVRFSWAEPTVATPFDGAVPTTLVVVYYSLDTAKGTLTRRMCKGGVTTDVVVGRRLVSAVATCTPSCDVSATTVSLTLRGSGLRAPLAYTLKASMRTGTQDTPTAANSASVPLLTLGRAACPNLRLAGTGAVTVRGEVLVSTCPGGSAVSGDQGVLRPTRAGPIAPLAGINDPYVGQTATAPDDGGRCAAGGVNPVIGASPGVDDVVVYPRLVTIVGNTAFAPGRYVFCAGLSITGGEITGHDVLFAVKTGPVTIAATAKVDLAGREDGADANQLLQVTTGGAAISIAGGPRVTSLRGVIYAPTSPLVLSSAHDLNVGGVVAKEVTINGAGSVRIGLPLPVVTVEPAALPLGEVGLAYRATTLVASDGSAPYTWSATGLPAGLTIAPATGVISGTPTAAGTFADIVVTVVDATAQASSFDYAVDVDTAMVVTFAALGNAEVGVAYPPMTPTVSGGTSPYTWSATALPVGLSIDATTGTISGTPTVAGPYPLAVTVTGGLAGTATTTYAVVVAASLTATWAPALPRGQVAVAYAPTAMTAGDGATPYRWSATGLPAGLAIDPVSGTISGTPTVAGSAAVVVSVVDALGASLIRSYTVTVNPPLNAAWPTVPQGQVGEAYTTTMLASGGTPPYVWSATGLPPGLTLGAANGSVSGVPGDDGTYAVTIRVTDGAGAVLAASYALVVVPAPVVCPGTVAGWRGVYYPNVSLAGEPGQCRDDPAIDFDWGTGTAGPDLPADGFSVRWTRTQAFAAGAYTFSMGSDDGSRLYIDGVLVLDRWVDGLYPTPVPAVAVDLTEGSHTIDMEYFDTSGPARATLTWVRSTSASCTGTAAGWFAQYFSNPTLAGPPAACRDEAEIDADWVGGAPLAGMPTDNFSVRWTRTQTFTAGAYNFALGTDDGGRLYLDGVLVLDRWFDQLYPSPPPNVTRPVSAGPHVIVVEYYDRTGSARAELSTTYVTPPTTPVLAFGGFTNTYWSGTGTTVYYRSTVAGSFTTTASSTDPAWGIASYAFPALGTKWTSTPGASGVTTYTYAVSPTAPGTKNITATNTTGVASALSPFTVTSDTTAPAGTLSYTNSATAVASINVTLTASDSGAGVASRLLQVQSAPLLGSTCGTYGAFETLANGTNPVSPVATPITLGQCYKYRYLVTDNVGNLRTATSTSVVKARMTYANTVLGTAGLISYWRLGDTVPFTADSFTGAAGATVPSRLGERGATWVKLGGDAGDAVLTAANRVRKGGTDTTGGAVYYSSGVPSTTYTVYADIFVASSLPGDVVGVVGRVDIAAPAGTYYLAAYEQATQTWVLYRRVAGVQVQMFRSATAQPLTVGATYRLSLYMSGSTVRLLVNGVQQYTVSDPTAVRISATGKAGFVLGNGVTATTTSDATGMQIDSFTGSTSTPPMLDARAVNTGTYLNGPILGAVTALIGDTNPAVQLDGVNDYGNVARQISTDFSIELWFKSTVGGIGTGPEWWTGAGLVDASVNGTFNDFGIALRADGRVVAGVGNPDVSITSPGAYQDGLWHHVVFTRSVTSVPAGALRLYVDGALAASGTGNTAALVDAPAINFGRLLSGSNSFNGYLDEISMYNVALSPETVTAHFYGGK